MSNDGTYSKHINIKECSNFETVAIIITKLKCLITYMYVCTPNVYLQLIIYSQKMLLEFHINDRYT